MKLFLKSVIVVCLLVAIGGYIYWQNNKRTIIKDSIKTTVNTKTESLYSIHYDSSNIDEINGNAAFYNVVLQSDSTKRNLMAGMDSLPNTLFHISVEKVSAIGVDMVGLLQKQDLSAKSILLFKPVVQIISTGANKSKPFTYQDTLELYEKILGGFKSIHADIIKVVGATVLMTDLQSKPLTTLENINITLNNLSVDSTHDYQNIISYFIKDVKVTVDNIQLPELKNGTRINITKLLYDAPAKNLEVGNIQQYRAGNNIPVIDVKNIVINKLNTDAFILNHELHAGMLTCDGGLVTIYRQTKKKLSGGASIKFSSDLFDEVKVDGIKLGSTKFLVVDLSEAAGPAIIINDVKFNATAVESLTSGYTIDHLINNASWQLSAAGFAFESRLKFYTFIASDIKLDNKKRTVQIKKIALKPNYSEEKFGDLVKFQNDRFDFNFNNINLQGVNFEKMINENTLEVDHAELQPILKIFTDGTLPPAPLKTAKYPHQAIAALKFPFYVKSITLKNGAVFYKEKNEDTHLIGIPSFENLNATLDNVTNIKEKIALNGILRLRAKTVFLKEANLSTEWLLPLNPADTTFIVKGEMGPIDAMSLNKITEPLGMVSIKSGTINSLQFIINGNNYAGTGTSTLLYNNLKIEILKMKNEHLIKKGFLSFLANTLIKNDNPKNNNIYVSDINYKKGPYGSFFGLLWFCIFDGVKKTALRK